MAKLTKGERRNLFIMHEAHRRSEQFARHFLDKHASLVNMPSSDQVAEGALTEILDAMSEAYMRGVLDALDTEDGKKLEEVG